MLILVFFFLLDHVLVLLAQVHLLFLGKVLVFSFGLFGMNLLPQFLSNLLLDLISFGLLEKMAVFSHVLAKPLVVSIIAAVAHGCIVLTTIEKRFLHITLIITL